MDMPCSEKEIEKSVVVTIVISKSKMKKWNQ